jgi:hypothetical protein
MTRPIAAGQDFSEAGGCGGDVAAASTTGQELELESAG